MTRVQPSAAAQKGGVAERFAEVWSGLERIGADPSGGYTRLAWTPADTELRAWFHEQAARRDMASEQDANGNLWAWWGDADGTPEQRAVVTGSHLDSVPNGGAFDGPLGVVSGFLAVDELRRQGRRPTRPIAVACFSDEEGGRFGIACVGSRLMTGAIRPEPARALVDGAGISLARAMEQAGADPGAIGSDPERLSRIAAFVELHVEQGRFLADVPAPIGVATAIWPHGRWRCTFRGQANHAGTTRLEDRRDPMLAFATSVLAARTAAESLGGRATNAIASRVDAWLDARAPDVPTLRRLVDELADAARRAGASHDVGFDLEPESVTDLVELEHALRARISACLGGAPELPTAAGHDAATLAGHVPAAMLFVRNPTGVSHSPDEHARLEDCVAGVVALTHVLAELTGA